VDPWVRDRWEHNRGKAGPPPDLDADDVVASAPPPDPRDPDVRRARTIARLLDDHYVDPILGFFLPGVGDLVGSLVGLYIVSIAARRRLPGIVIARMLLNLAIDAALGVVPVLGDLGDVAFKANDRNLALLEARVERRESWRDWIAVVGALALFLGTLVGLVWLLVRAFESVV
jgi:hypothetical protein